jgi:hypothetical protein
MTRFQFLATISALPFLAGQRAAAAATNIHVYKTPTCSCCGKWVQHLRDNGFTVTVQDVPDTAPYRKKSGIPENMASCHTGVVGSYGIEGHVPATEIQRLLKEHPQAKALAVPGMPIGSPGMEAGTTRQPYSVMLIDAQGKAAVYQKYPR